ncbi:MAG: C40 family peptidase [Phycisphaerae bacterium]|nr:C40 family peptidase [Phycisphaerae bacterium]
MKRFGVVLLALCVWSPLLLHAADRDAASPAVQATIDAFVPIWNPTRGQMPRIVVVLDPVRIGSADVAERQADEQSLWTAGYLFHLIRSGGGVGVLARVDDCPIPPTSNDKASPLEAFCDEAKGHVVVRVEFVLSPKTKAAAALVGVVTPGGSDPLSLAFAEALGESVGVNVGSAPDAPALRLPSATLRVTSEGPAGPVPVYRIVAEQVYKGLEAFAQAHRDALVAARAARLPQPAATMNDAPEGFRAVEAPRTKLERAARAIWPEGDLPAAMAPWFCRMFRTVPLSDHAIVHFEPEVVIEDGRVIVRGATTVPALRDSIEDALRAVGVKDVRNEMRVLPEQGEQGDCWLGICVAPMARTYAKPSELASSQTQLFYGDPVFVLDQRAGHYLVQATDGYWGWVRREAVLPQSREAFAEYAAARQAVLLHDVDTPVLRIRRGSRLPVASDGADGLVLRTPTGETVNVPAGGARLIEGLAAWREAPMRALPLLYRPYLFAGRSSIGLDCSGLVANICEQGGLTSARDAAQQFLSGRLVATRWYRDGIRPGDRLYFIDATGKVYHTGIAISPTHLVHCSPPCVRINSLHEGDRLYNETLDQCFVGAKRP